VRTRPDGADAACAEPLTCVCAGQRSTAISDPLGPAGTPQFLPTITESSDPKARGGAGQMPHQIPYTQQHHMQQHYLQYHAQPPAHQRRYQPNDEQNRSNGSLHPAPHHFLGQQQHHGGQNVPNGGQNWFLPPIPVHAGGGWGRGFGNAVGASEQDWAARGGGWGGGGGVGGDWRGGGGGGWGYEDSQDGVARVRHHMSNVHGNGHLPHRAPNAFASSPRAAGRDGGGNGDSSGARGGGGVNPRHKRLSGAAPRGAGGAGVDVQRQSVNSSVGSSAAPSPRKNRYRKSAASDSPSPVRRLGEYVPCSRLRARTPACRRFGFRDMGSGHACAVAQVRACTHAYGACLPACVRRTRFCAMREAHFERHKMIDITLLPPFPSPLPHPRLPSCVAAGGMPAGATESSQAIRSK